jgi:hypothetical protein
MCVMLRPHGLVPAPASLLRNLAIAGVEPAEAPYAKTVVDICNSQRLYQFSVVIASKRLQTKKLSLRLMPMRESGNLLNGTIQ